MTRDKRAVCVCALVGLCGAGSDRGRPQAVLFRTRHCGPPVLRLRKVQLVKHLHVRACYCLHVAACREHLLHETPIKQGVSPTETAPHFTNAIRETWRQYACDIACCAVRRSAKVQRGLDGLMIQSPNRHRKLNVVLVLTAVRLPPPSLFVGATCCSTFQRIGKIGRWKGHRSALQKWLTC
jgi:hypothetical protein